MSAHDPNTAAYEARIKALESERDALRLQLNDHDLRLHRMREHLVRLARIYEMHSDSTDHAD